MNDKHDSRIVVGVDGSPSSVAALRWAIRQASVTGAVVEAVTAWHLPAAYGLAPVDEAAMDFEGDAEKILADALNQVSGISGGVAIHASVVEGLPAVALAQAARGADLLVVGSRGHGGFTGALLGSVSQYCAHRAPCPVLILRETAEHHR